LIKTWQLELNELKLGMLYPIYLELELD